MPTFLSNPVEKDEISGTSDRTFRIHELIEGQFRRMCIMREIGETLPERS